MGLLDAPISLSLGFLLISLVFALRNAQELLTTAVQQGYQLTDYEAMSFLPFLLIKVRLLIVNVVAKLWAM